MSANTNTTGPATREATPAHSVTPGYSPSQTQPPAETREPVPDRLLELGLAFWGAKTLLSGVELGVFTLLARGSMAAREIGAALGLHPRGLRDFLDALVALGVLDRRGNIYSNTPEADLFLDRSKPSYIGGLLQMAEHRLYPSWGNLTQALRDGLPQNEVKDARDTFAEMYADPARLKEFLSAMTGISLGVARALAQAFPWANYRTFVDVGAAQGCVPVQLALAHPHLRGANFDLPQVGPVFEEYVRSFGLQDRLAFLPGNFFKDPLPKADVIVMGHILHDWSLEEKRLLVAKAYEALPAGGAFVVYESIIDDDRRKNAFGLLMSLNMLIETKQGFDFTGADCIGWMREAGFKETRVESLCGPDSMVVGFK